MHLFAFSEIYTVGLFVESALLINQKNRNHAKQNLKILVAFNGPIFVN